VSVGNNTTEAVVGSDGAVVRSLGAGVAIRGPAERPGGEFRFDCDQLVFLLNAEPRLFVSASIKDFLSMDAEVGVGWLENLAGTVGPLVGVAHDEDVVATAEGVLEDGDGAHDDLRVIGVGLVARRTIIVPLGALLDGSDLALQSSALRAERDATAVNPDVLGDGDVFDLTPAALNVDVLVVEGEVHLVCHGVFVVLVLKVLS